MKSQLFLSLLFTTLLLSCKDTYPASAKTKVQIVAHRGDWNNYPENSLEGIESCIRLGLDMVEMDLSMTKDSVLILMHDATLERTTNGEGTVSDMTYESLSGYRLKDKAGKLTTCKIPLFAEVLESCRGKIKIFADKGYELIPLAVPLLEQKNMLDEVHFLSFVNGESIKQQYPGLSDRLNFMPLLTPSDSLAQYLQSFENLKTPYFLCSFNELNPAFLAIVDAWSKKYFMMATTQEAKYCAGRSDDISLHNPSEGWGWITDQGFNAICTDYPKALKAFLNQ